MPVKPGQLHRQQAERYYITDSVDIPTALARFGQDLGEHNNPAVPVVGLFLAAARSVGRLRTASLDEISPHDLGFAITTREILNGAFVGVRFEMSRVDRHRRDLAPWVGSPALESVDLETGFGYDALDYTTMMSADALVFRSGEGMERRVDCTDLVGGENALLETRLRIAPGMRGELLDRFHALGFAPPEPPQVL